MGSVFPAHPSETRLTSAMSSRTSNLLRRFYRFLPPPPSTNYNLDQLNLDPYDLLPDRARVLDIGSGPLEGAYAFRREGGRDTFRFVAMDLVPAGGVQLCADAHALPIRSASFDGVFCVSTLEYLASPETMIQEALRILKPGGIIYLSAPFLFPYHGPPDDLFRFSPVGLRVLARDFEVIHTGSNRGPASSFCHILVHFLAVTFSFNSRRLYGVLLDVFKWCFFWVKFIDRWIGHYELSAILYGSAFFLGRKRSPS